MERDEAKDILRRSYRERVKAVAAQRGASKKIKGLNSIIDGILQLFPDLKYEVDTAGWPPPNLEAEETKLRGAEAVKEVLRQRRGEGMTVAEIVEALDELDWMPDSDNPPAAVRTALARLLSNEPHFFAKGHRVFVDATGSKLGPVVYYLRSYPGGGPGNVVPDPEPDP